jgi:acyl carrier protein
MSSETETEQKIIAAITPVFRSVFEDGSLVVTRDLDASRVEAWDSLNHITLIVELERLAGVTFTTDELATMANVGDLVECLIAKGYRA